MLEEFDVGEHGLGFTADVLVRAVELLLDGSPLDMEIVETLAKFAARERCLSGQIKEAFLLDVELGEFFLEPRMCFAFNRQALFEMPGDLRTHS